MSFELRLKDTYGRARLHSLVLSPLVQTPGDAADELAAVQIKLREAAAAAAQRSYAPYSGAAAGVALLFEDGRIAAGSYLESAAFNPSMPPMQAALITAIAEGACPPL